MCCTNDPGRSKFTAFLRQGATLPLRGDLEPERRCFTNSSLVIVRELREYLTPGLPVEALRGRPDLAVPDFGVRDVAGP